MDDQKNDALSENPQPPKADSGKVIDLNKVRSGLLMPTGIIVALAERDGKNILNARPGRVDIELDEQTGLAVGVRKVNIHELEAKAYQDAGLPVPDSVIREIERWNMENRGSE